MAKSWYMVQTYTGYEDKIERTIRTKLDAGEIDSSVLTDVKVPKAEETVENKSGKKVTRKNKILPGYIMVEMDLPQIGWKNTCSEIRRIQGVNGFVGTDPNVRPRPITNAEARNILQMSGDIKADKSLKIKQPYSVGDKVKVISGSFASFEGSVEEVDAEKGRLRILLQIFGRSTPVDVAVNEVEKLIS